ncbi:hypothetical protein ACN47E_000996 [Coniothyrium glycines]
MTDAHYEPQQQPQYKMPDMDNASESKRRKIIGQCPTSDESDAISFGEMSDFDSLEGEDPYAGKPFTSAHEPSLDDDGFEFSDSSHQPEFDFLRADPGISPNHGPDHGSVHTIYDEDEQPSTGYEPFGRNRFATPQKQARGILYCGACDKYFGNEKVFKRHFMFGVKHGMEPRDMRDLYYRVWAKTWEEEAREMGQQAQFDDTMEL